MNVSNIYVTGILSPIKRKSLPEIAKVVGINSSQSLHHFIANSPWSVEELGRRRLRLTLEALKDQKITVVIDETGDRKKRCVRGATTVRSPADFESAKERAPRREQKLIMYLDKIWEVSEK